MVVDDEVTAPVVALVVPDVVVVGVVVVVPVVVGVVVPVPISPDVPEESLPTERSTSVVEVVWSLRRQAARTRSGRRGGR